MYSNNFLSSSALLLPLGVADGAGPDVLVAVIVFVGCTAGIVLLGDNVITGDCVNDATVAMEDGIVACDTLVITPGNVLLNDDVMTGDIIVGDWVSDATVAMEDGNGVSDTLGNVMVTTGDVLVLINGENMSDVTM